MAKIEVIHEKVIGSDGRINYLYGGELVRCKDCIHKPTTKGRDYGCDVDFPDEDCPFFCEDDEYYNRMPPNDDFYCGYGERKVDG